MTSDDYECRLTREQLIRRIDRFWDPGVQGGRGIGGGAVCQICGRLGVYSGIASIIGTHRGGLFTHAWCFGGGESVAARDYVRCEICREGVPRGEDGSRVGRWTLCAACRRSLALLIPARDPVEALRSLSRLRRRRLASEDGG